LVLELLEARTVPGFLSPVNYAAGPGPSSVAVGDFRGIGVFDLVVADFASGGNGGVSVLLGNSDGTFQSPVFYATGNHPLGVAVGDFRHIGVLDLVTADYAVAGGTVSVLLGNGDGTFRSPVQYLTAPHCFAVAVGDFNGDGNLDIVTANGGHFDIAGTVSVLLGKGDGTFLPAMSYAAGPYPVSVAVGDFKGDGTMDIAVANNAENGTVSVLLGNGDGTFQPAVSYAAGVNPASVAMGGFTGNGKLDLVVTNDDFYNVGTVSVLLGNGDGTFQPAVQSIVGDNPSAVAVGDFNGDGKLDLAVTSSDHFYVTVLLGNGDGSFQPTVFYQTPLSPISVAVGDFNGDGFPDLAVANFYDSSVSILLNDGQWATHPRSTSSLSRHDAQAMLRETVGSEGIATAGNPVATYAPIPLVESVASGESDLATPRQPGLAVLDGVFAADTEVDEQPMLALVRSRKLPLEDVRDDFAIAVSMTLSDRGFFEARPFLTRSASLIGAVCLHAHFMHWEE
jgi:hypothetical protein